LLLLADVLLDPLLFGGVNTTFDALSLGKVIVTLPGRFQRGRYTYGCLRTIGVDAGIAESVEDYVARALRLAGDRDYRRSVEVQILEAGGLLFENAQAAKELQELLVGLVEAARS
jgi:predicted O-linked N-acetylglucosamine transferase (SPINDLY family)